MRLLVTTAGWYFLVVRRYGRTDGRMYRFGSYSRFVRCRKFLKEFLVFSSFFKFFQIFLYMCVCLDDRLSALLELLLNKKKSKNKKKREEKRKQVKKRCFFLLKKSNLVHLSPATIHQLTSLVIVVCDDDATVFYMCVWLCVCTIKDMSHRSLTKVYTYTCVLPKRSSFSVWLSVCLFGGCTLSYKLTQMYTCLRLGLLQ